MTCLFRCKAFLTTGPVWIASGATRYKWVSAPDGDDVSCTVRGRGETSDELFISNNTHKLRR